MKQEPIKPMTAFRTTPTEREQLKAKANAAGMTISAYIRQALEEAAWNHEAAEKIHEYEEKVTAELLAYQGEATIPQ